MADDLALQAERHHLRLARDCLVQMRAAAEHIADYGVDELSAFALGRLRSERLDALDADPDAPPFFGRTDRDADGGGPREVLHIGRRHVRDPAGDPVVVDWRAPVSGAFYRATVSDRMGVGLRRRFGFHDGELTSMEDEHLDLGEALGLDSALLRQEIERPRVGPMRDIVATIQPDQDELVRADLDTSLCIQGAPGTGKTAVGLHRAAYLLYTYPQRLRRSGVLVVGPNQAFLHYIAQVLPSLGEGGITQSTVDGLLPFTARGTEPESLAIVKQDIRMADVLRRAMLSYVAKPTEDVVAVVGTRRFRIGAHHLRRYVDDARRAVDAGLKWSTARDRLRRQVAEDVRRQREDAGGAPSDAETERVARTPAVRTWLERTWPALSAPSLLARLYSDPEFLSRCGRTLTPGERDALFRPAPRAVSTIHWTPADVLLLDELAGLLDDTETFVHAVVDEAQDLSAMQCRAVARRCPLGSLTVLGDLAQATTPWAPGRWSDTMDHLGREAQVRPLTAGYRVPGEVLDLANRLLPHIAQNVPPATSIRQGTDVLGYAPRSALVASVSECLAAAGSVAVVCVGAATVLAELAAAGIDAAPLDAEHDARVTVVPAFAAKGLEFDSVIVVEPADIVDAETFRVNGLRRLYVVLTRAVSRLRINHDRPLPHELG